MNATPNRRGLLLGALTAGAAATVAAVPAIAITETPDPVFALLEAHKRAWARLLETEDRTDDYEALEEAGRAADAALDAIMKDPADVVAGARAVIEYLVEWDKGSGDYDYLPTLLRSPLLAA